MRTITVPHEATILCVEDDLARRHFYLSKYRMPDAYLSHMPDDAIQAIDRYKPSHIFLDFDLDPVARVDSTAVAKHLAATKYDGTVVIVSQNPFGQTVLGKFLPQAVMAPFGTFEIVRAT